jgi:hypothetical protein
METKSPPHTSPRCNNIYTPSIYQPSAYKAKAAAPATAPTMNDPTLLALAAPVKAAAAGLTV